VKLAQLAMHRFWNLNGQCNEVFQDLYSLFASAVNGKFFVFFSWKNFFLFEIKRILAQIYGL